jgi:hypothetical protein
MTKEYENILIAKRRIKSHIIFFQKLLSHLKSPNKLFRQQAAVSASCLDSYINLNLRQDVNSIMVEINTKETKDSK